MRIKDAVSARDFLNRHGNGSAVSPAAPSLETNIELRPTTDEAKLNKLETAWLEVLRNRGYMWIGIQNITLKLGDDCRYIPDFWALDGGKLLAFETKGFMEDDALVKIKTAARQFPWLIIVLVKRERGVWSEVEVRP